MIVSGAPVEMRGIEELATNKTRGFTVESRCNSTSSNLLTTTSVPSVNSEELGEPLQSGCFTPRFSFNVDDDNRGPLQAPAVSPWHASPWSVLHTEKSPPTTTSGTKT